jgi:hypothetical protein
MKLAGIVIGGAILLAAGVGMIASFPYPDTLGFMIGIASIVLGALAAVGGTLRWVLAR